ncbi:hypothetical protein ACJJI5_03980 [Microbulbifer sp. EKSA008]|uniref:hypothetical protein n=1 Tax=unclassified Microbulbifer TaxID=2619833 RepID=UPI00403A60FE
MIEKIKAVYSRNITARLRWLAMRVPRLVWFFMAMLTFAFVPILLVLKFQIFGYDLTAFRMFAESGFRDHRYLGLASILFLWSCLVGYFANASWLFFRKAAEGAF